MDPNNPLFQGYPETSLQAIHNFADVVNGYAQFVVPITTPASQQLAVQSFITTMMPLTSTPSTSGPTFMSLFPLAMMSYATQLALGMQPTFTATPPVTPLILDSVWQIGLNGGTTQQVISAMVPIIDTWFKTGIAVNNTSGATITWL